MIPVLVVSAIVYRKKHLQREWVAGGVILAGCACYLFSTPPTPHGSHALTSAEDKTTLDGLIGTGFLLGYLFFDGLVSTTREYDVPYAFLNLPISRADLFLFRAVQQRRRFSEK